MPHNTTEVTIDEDQLDARLTELLRQMSKQYETTQPHPANGSLSWQDPYSGAEDISLTAM
jgi:hypothetical protein